MAVFFETPPTIIGKHQWRCVVKDGRYGIVTEYQFRSVASGDNASWQEDRQWPTYNINDGMFMGMPKSLVDLYSRYEPQIKAALEGKPIPESAQASLLPA